MPRILDTDETTTWISHISEDAKRHILIISPYLKINQRLRRILEVADSKGVGIYMVYGKRKLEQETMDWMKGLRHSNIAFVPNLHAKLYMNEDDAVMSSMNLYEFSQVNNEELGIHFSSKDDKALFKDLTSHALRIISRAEREHGQWDLRTIGRPVNGVFGRSRSAVPPQQPVPAPKVQTTAPAVRSPERRGPASKATGRCIRCGGRIPAGNMLVYCGRCFESWSRNPNIHYVEPDGVCCICGEHHFSSASHPSCARCFESNKELVMAKCRAMKSFCNKG